MKSKLGMELHEVKHISGDILLIEQVELEIEGDLLVKSRQLLELASVSKLQTSKFTESVLLESIVQLVTT